MINYVAPYFKVRELCHALKNGSKKAIIQSANLLSQFVSSNDAIIPMPSHLGYATYMYDIASIIKEKTNCTILDTLYTQPHERWYDTKKRTGINSDLGYEFQAYNSPTPLGTIYVIDNVYSSGKTMNSALAKVKQVYPNSNVEGLVIGLVDDETIKRLNYTSNLHESRQNQQKDQYFEVYDNYLKKNGNKLKSLIIKFLQNENEGEKLYQPSIRSAAINTETDNPYLRFNRIFDKETDSTSRIWFDGDESILDLDYINKVLKFFLFMGREVEKKYYGSFEYDDGKLQYVIRLIDNLEKDENNNYIYVNGHPITKKGKHVHKFGKVKSPEGMYYAHNYDKNSNAPLIPGKIWDKYFNPVYYVYNGNKKFQRLARSKQTGGGQFPQHWFPKNNKDSKRDLSLLAKLIEDSIHKYNNVYAPSLFIAFLKGIDSGEINGYQLFKNCDRKYIIQYCINSIFKETA